MTIGLALSGGGARGIAHLGVLKALDELGVKPQMISGTSAGAILGAFYAYGYKPDAVLEFIEKLSFFRMMRPAISKNGLLKMDRWRQELIKYLPENTFEHLKVPLVINATDVVAGKTTFFSQGNLIDPILASCCAPVIFDPFQIDGHRYIDGGILNNLPIEPLLSQCQLIIGSHCNPVNPNFKLRNAKTLLERTLHMAIGTNTIPRQQKCQILLEPPELRTFLSSDFKKIREIYKIGYRHTMEQKEKFEHLLSL